MRILIIYAHPNPTSFNHAIKETVAEELSEKGYEVKVRDLYALQFNPILTADDFNQHQDEVPQDVKKEQEKIGWADLLVFVYPTWWMSMPAILKGYLDRVLTNGFAYQDTEDGAEPLLSGKKAFVLQTTGESIQLLDKTLIDSMKVTMKEGILNFCGIETIEHKFFYGVSVITDDDRSDMLEELKKFLNTL